MQAGRGRATRALITLIGGCAMLTSTAPDAAAQLVDDGPSGGARFSPPAGERARLTTRRLAVAPAAAPPEIVAVISAANQIARKPYRYGGGHGRWGDKGYDCSGSISFALHGARLLRSPLASGGFMRWGARGRGRWITTYANAGHAYMVVAGLRFDTSARKRTGSRWTKVMRSGRGYKRRHPIGL